MQGSSGRTVGITLTYKIAGTHSPFVLRSRPKGGVSKDRTDYCPDRFVRFAKI